MTIKDRDVGIDLMRSLMMFGICVLHTAHLGVPFAVLSANSIFWALFVCSVDGFVFISGYYGIKFRPSKIISLYGIGVFCALINLVGLIAHGQSIGCAAYNVFERLFRGTWFLHAYVVLMCFAPALNYCMSENDRKSALIFALPIIGLVFGWTWLSGEFTILKIPFPCSTGFGSHTWLTLIGVYVVARLYKIMDLDSVINVKMVLMILPILTVATAFYRGILGSYNSPQIILFTVLIFWLFKHIKLSRLFAKVIVLVTPSLLSVYLLHYGPFGRLMYEKFAYLKPVNGCMTVVGSALFAFSIFILSIIADIPRRLVVKALAVPIKALEKKIDVSYQSIVEKVTGYA